MPQFLFWCAFEHLDFRLPEFEAIAELFNINLKWIDRNQSHPWVIIELDSISDAKLICSRSISTKFCAELWTQSEKRDTFHENVAKYFKDNKLEFGADVSFKVQVTFVSCIKSVRLKFVYSEKTTKFCEIFTVHTEKSKVEITQNFVAFSEYMNYKSVLIMLYPLDRQNTKYEY